MAYFLGSTSHNTTGVKTITVGFQPIGVRITTGPNGGSESAAHQSVGVTDGTNSVCDSLFQDATRGKSDRFSDRLVSVWEWNGAAFTEVCKATFDSFTATQLKYNVTTANVNYQFKIEAWS